MKLMKPELADDSHALESFYRGPSLRRTEPHQHHHIYTFDESNGHRYLVMELADRGSLDGRIEQEQRLPNWMFWISASKSLPPWTQP